MAGVEPGRILGERYRLDHAIGDGGTATIWVADDVTLGIRCAVKVLKPEALGDPTLRSRLIAESATMARLAHPNILRVYGAGSDGVDWIAMELAEAGSVADRVRAEGPFSPLRSLQIVLQLLGALEAAHAAGVVHRDVKPDNLLLQSDGSVKLADFGIALLDDQTRLTRAGYAMGSLPYMAPEQRVDAHGVGPRADVYAAGATLYHLLTGATPVDLFLAPPQSPRFAGIPEGIVELLRRATHADPERRFPDAAAMAEAVRHCLPHASDRVVETTTPHDDERVPTELPETSRVDGAPRDDSAELERLEEQLHREWRDREQDARRRFQRRLSSGSLAVGMTLLGIVVAVGARLSLEEWLDRAEVPVTRSVPELAGEWKGILGPHLAQLELRGDNTALDGRLHVALGKNSLFSRLSGAVEGAEVVMRGPGDAGELRGSVIGGARLDGTFELNGRVEPFHLVRVDPASADLD